MEDWHIHIALDAQDWKAAARRHRNGADEGWLRGVLEAYRAAGFTHLRDGGDKWGVSQRAAMLAPEYGITYRTPLYALSKRGHYGGFLGLQFEDETDFARHVRHIRETGGNFVKLMASGCMDFDRPGQLTEASLPPSEIRQLLHISHEEGMAVMVHANGDVAVEAAALGGAGSIEHGGCICRDTAAAIAENDVVWVPTLTAVASLQGSGRFPEAGVRAVLENTMGNLSFFAAIGYVAPGSDGGAWPVPHAGKEEMALLHQAIGDEAPRCLTGGMKRLRVRF